MREMQTGAISAVAEKRHMLMAQLKVAQGAGALDDAQRAAAHAAQQVSGLWSSLVDACAEGRTADVAGLRKQLRAAESAAESAAEILEIAKAVAARQAGESEPLAAELVALDELLGAETIRAVVAQFAALRAEQEAAHATLRSLNSKLRAMINLAYDVHTQGRALVEWGNFDTALGRIESDSSIENAYSAELKAALAAAGADLDVVRALNYRTAERLFRTALPGVICQTIEQRPEPGARTEVRPRVLIDGIEQGRADDGTVRARHEPTFRVQPPAVPDFYG